MVTLSVSFVAGGGCREASRAAEEALTCLRHLQSSLPVPDSEPANSY